MTITYPGDNDHSRDKFYVYLGYGSISVIMLMAVATNYYNGVDPRFVFKAMTPIPLIAFVSFNLLMALVASRHGKPKFVTAFLSTGLMAMTCLAAYSMSLEVHATGIPLQDAALLEKDRSMGFHWDAYAAAITSRPWLAFLMSISYRLMGLLGMLAVIALYLSRPSWEAYRYVAFYGISSILGLALALQFPAIGMFEWADKSQFVNGDFYETPKQIVMLMRRHATDRIDTSTLYPMLTFPSWHTLGALTMAYGFHNTIIRYPATAIAATIPFAAIFNGAHYLTDILGAFGVFAAALAILHALEWGRRRFVDSSASPFSTAQGLDGGQGNGGQTPVSPVPEGPEIALG